jgi:hypothetical protein
MSRSTAIIQHLNDSRTALRAVLDRLSSAAWEMPVQEEGEHWTARQIVSHLVDAQRGMLGQMTKINDGVEAIPPDFDLSRWNIRAVGKMAERTPDDLLAQLNDDHIKLTAFLSSLTDADLDKRGRHSSLQIMSIEEIARLIGDHEREHAQAIAAKVG